MLDGEFAVLLNNYVIIFAFEITESGVDEYYFANILEEQDLDHLFEEGEFASKKKFKTLFEKFKENYEPPKDQQGNDSPNTSIRAATHDTSRTDLLTQLMG